MMEPKNLILIMAMILCFHETLGLTTSVKTTSDYARVTKNVGDDPGSASGRINATGEPLGNVTEETPEYEDFDDLAEERGLSQPQPPSPQDLVKYVSGLISLLTLMYRYNGIPPKGPKNQAHDSDRATGKGFDVSAQDRFDFPQKKFKKVLAQPSDGDQQYQPVENYPPYNPLTANKAETYGNDDKKTSYEVYDSTKDSGQIYGVPYETAKPAKQSTYDAGSTWNLHPVYQPWTSKPENNDGTADSYSTIDSYQPWQGDIKTGNDGYDSRQPWTGNSPSSGYPIYNHDFDIDHHHHEEIEHAVDEDRVSKKPYSYYFLGRKLWYVPLLFSVYFIVYIGALVLKSVARHKIQFPEKVWDLHEDVYGKHRKQRQIDEITETYEKAIDNIKDKYM